MVSYKTTDCDLESLIEFVETHGVCSLSGGFILFLLYLKRADNTCWQSQQLTMQACFF